MPLEEPSEKRPKINEGTEIQIRSLKEEVEDEQKLQKKFPIYKQIIELRRQDRAGNNDMTWRWKKRFGRTKIAERVSSIMLEWYKAHPKSMDRERFDVLNSIEDKGLHFAKLTDLILEALCNDAGYEKVDVDYEECIDGVLKIVLDWYEKELNNKDEFNKFESQLEEQLQWTKPRDIRQIRQVVPERKKRKKLDTGEKNPWIAARLEEAHNIVPERGKYFPIGDVMPGLPEDIYKHGKVISLNILEEPVEEFDYEFTIKTGDSIERWYINQPLAITQWFVLHKANPDGTVDRLSQCFVKAEDIIKPYSEDSNEFYVYLDNILEIISRANRDREVEKQRAGLAKQFELANEKEQVGYIGLYDKDDPLVRSMKGDIAHFPEVLSRRYSVLAPEQMLCSAVDKSPKKMLEEYCDYLVDRKITTIFINISGHGAPSSEDKEGRIRFGPDGKYNLRPSELHAIFSKYPQCKFVVNVNACFGGGIASHLKDYKDPTAKTGRIAVILQSKGISPNLASVEVGGECSTLYSLFLTQYLIEGLNGERLTFGEAHYYADLKAKKYGPVDAELWISGPSGSTRIAKKESELSDEPV